MWKELYLYLLLFIKLIIIYLWLKKKFEHDEKTAHTLSVFELIFDGLMAFLMIYLFHPYSPNPIYIDRETKLFLFTFAVLTLAHTFA